MTRADAPDNYAAYVGEPSTTELIRGGSVIVVPFSEVIAGPLRGRESVLSSSIDLDDLIRGKCGQRFDRRQQTS